MAFGKVLCFQIMFTIATGICVFPYFLRKKSWMYKLSAEPYFQSTVEFTQNAIIFRDRRLPGKDVSNSRIIHCLNEIGFRRFIVNETDTNISSSKYRCIKIIERSKSIIQLAYSIYNLNYTDTLCSGTLNLDIWLLVTHADLQNEYISCPFQSGYNMKITDSFGYEHICNLMALPMRFESECLKGEGFILDFRKRDCVDFLPLEKIQKLVCLAQWTENDYIFVITRKANNRELLTFRYPTNYSTNSLKVNMYTDLIVPTDNEEIGIRYFILSLEKHVQTSVCADEYPECKYSDCSEYTKYQCRKTCSLCDPNNPPVICSFPLRLRGTWWTQSSRFNNNVTIQESDINIQSVGKFTCIVTSGNTISRNLFSTLSTFKNGCRPRVTCIDIRKMANNVLGYSISHSLVWPFTTSSDLICHDTQFREDVRPIYDAYRTNKNVLKPILPTSVNKTVPIDCKLVSSFRFNATINNRGECQGTLYQSCDNSTLLHMQFEKCRYQRYDMTFLCVAYIPGNGQNILFLQDLYSHKPICLVYSTIQKSQLIMLPSEECDSYSWLYIETLKRTPIMHLTTTRESEVCREIPTTTTSTTTSTTAIYTPESRVEEVLTTGLSEVLTTRSSKEFYLPDKISLYSDGDRKYIDLGIYWIICILNIASI